jgi:hypothetical protein
VACHPLRLHAMALGIHLNPLYTKTTSVIFYCDTSKPGLEIRDLEVAGTGYKVF